MRVAYGGWPLAKGILPQGPKRPDRWAKETLKVNDLAAHLSGLQLNGVEYPP